MIPSPATCDARCLFTIVWLSGPTKQSTQSISSGAGLWSQRRCALMAKRSNASAKTGWLGCLRADSDSVEGRLPPIVPHNVSLEEYDLLIICAPIQMSYITLLLRSHLPQKPPLPDRVAPFLTLGGHSPAEKIVKLVNRLLPVPLEASLKLPQDQVVKGQRLTPSIHLSRS